MDDSTDGMPADPARHRDQEQRAIDRLWDFADPIASETRFREAAEAAETPHERAVMATQLARALGLQRRAADALAVLDGIDDGETAGGEPAEVAEVRSRVDLERGRLDATAGRRDDAVAAFTRAVREAVAAESRFLALDGVHMLALNDEGHEAEWAEEGLELLRGERDPHVLRWSIALHNNLGWTLHDAGDAEAGLHQFELAVEAADHFGNAGQQQVARWAVGRALRTLGRIDEALELQRALLVERPHDPWVRAEIDALTEAGPTIEA